MSTTTGLAARWKINATGEGEYTRRTPYRATFAWQVITIKVWSKSIAELCLVSTLYKRRKSRYYVREGQNAVMRLQGFHLEKLSRTAKYEKQQVHGKYLLRN